MHIWSKKEERRDQVAGVVIKQKIPFATWMQLEILILSEVTQKDKYHMISLTRGI